MPQKPRAGRLAGVIQCLPMMRLLHQPDRRGRSPVSFSVEPETTGSAEGGEEGVNGGELSLV